MALWEIVEYSIKKNGLFVVLTLIYHPTAGKYISNSSRITVIILHLDQLQQLLWKQT